ncbi:MAG: DUF4350 domain-containing protein [Bacteroidales bacterium]
MKNRIIFSILIFAVTGFLLHSQQVADTTFNPSIPKPEYPAGKGPVVYIDEGHNNFHTADGRYLPFARLLRADGYRVKGLGGGFEKPFPSDARILVIANALNKINISNWYLPTPSAFAAGEVEAVKKWVQAGGSLFLIADHMPFGGAAKDLAGAFGFRFTNGFAVDTTARGPSMFSRADNTILSNPVTDGRNASERVSKVFTFTGQGFTGPKEALPILKFSQKYLLLESDTAWVFDKTTKYTNISGWWQGACMLYGKGRIVVFGEAAMFTAQLAGQAQTRVGMNSEYAEENYRLLLNIVHWLDGGGK